MDEKMNFIKNDSPGNLPTSPLNPPDILSSPKIGVESAASVKSQDLSPIMPEKKKSNVFLWILVIIILVFISAAGAGYTVYYLQNRNTQPLIKEKALLQSQVGTLKSQVDVITKEKATLQLEVTRLEAELEAKKAPAEGTAPEAQPGQPTPNTPVNPGVPPVPGQ